MRADSSHQAGAGGALAKDLSAGDKDRMHKWHQDTIRRFFVLAGKMPPSVYIARLSELCEEDVQLDETNVAML